MPPNVRIRIYTMRLDGLDEQAVLPWRDVLDADEQAKSARFVFSRDRIAFIAAHALARVVLSGLLVAIPPRGWRFIPGEQGKPVAWSGDQPAPLSFNLSHTNGLVGVAVAASAGCDLGFDLETMDRKVPLEIADSYFCREELVWLRSLPEQARPDGFLRLWTLKEAFIKATGQGLTQDLNTFWFVPPSLRIQFVPTLPERTEDWHFEQRVISGRFLAAMGVRRSIDKPVTTEWIGVQSKDFSPDKPGAWNTGVDPGLWTKPP